MTEEEKKQSEQVSESVLDFEEAKELTIGQANRKAEELEAGVTPEDNILDKYIKQHRAEIEADKYDTKILAKEELNPEMSREEEKISLNEENAEISEPIVEPAKENPNLVERPEMDAISTELPAKIKFGPEPTEPYLEEEEEIVPLPTTSNRKVKGILYSVLALAVLGSAGFVTYNWIQQRGASGKTTIVSSSSSKKTSTSSSTSSTTSAQNLEEFNKAYDAFFVDDTKTTIKNDKFGDLENLQKTLAKLENTSDYEAAKAKYDELVKQISAIQAVNSQFQSPAIKDGVLDATATAKSDAQFTETTTANSQLNSVLKEAIAQGRSQQVATPAPVTGNETSSGAVIATPSPAPQVVAPATSNGGQLQPGYSGYGLSSQGVALQRNLSRVPYNQVAIDDVNNPAWIFADGVLDKVLNIARQRGHIVGNQFILERVNIIKGNGYYNLFKPDGTYLFSINAKTGYFVGNGKGHADALDY